MVLFNHATRELTAKIVYYGPGLCGKTSNLRVLHERLEKGTAGRLLSLATAQDRTIYFDLLPVELGNIKGYTVRFQLCTVPGQVFYNETRKLVLRGVDGIVFVVDSQWSMLSNDIEAFQNLKENLRDADVPFDNLPLVVQYNKRDLPGVLSIDALQESLNFQSYPFVEAVASSSQGVVETFKLISKLTFVDLLRRLQRGGGFEGDLFGSPDTAVRRLDPGEDTSIRPGGPPERRSTFALSRPSAVAAPEEEIPVEPALKQAAQSDQATSIADSPFDASASWLPPQPMGGLFSEESAGESDPFESAPAPSAPARPQTPPVTEAQPEVEAFAMEPAGVEEHSPESIPEPEMEPQAVLASQNVQVEPATQPEPELKESRHEAELVALRDEIHVMKAALAEALQEQTRVQDSHRSALQEAHTHEREGLVASLRVVESAQGALSQRMESLEREIARIAGKSDDAHRHSATRIETIDKRTRALADSIRRALDSLEEPET